MQLNLQQYDVDTVKLGDLTRLRDGCLSIDGDGLRAELLGDSRLADVEFEIVRPGESCRIVSVFDVVEPRAKIDPPGRDFPGALTAIKAVGFGVTRVLKGMAVTILQPDGRPAGAMIDMSSTPLPGYSAADISRLAGLRHLVLVPRLAPEVTGEDANRVLRDAVLRAAVWLARNVIVEGSRPTVRELRLSPVAEDLPRVAYVFQLHSHQRPTMPGEPVMYGDNVRYLLPTILHPNEIVDGAVVRPYAAMYLDTYSIQNHAVIADLYARHGVDLNFVGVVVYVANQLAAERERATVLATNLVCHTLRAQGAVFTKSGGGAPNVDMALIAEQCEALGVRTSLIVWEMGAVGATDQDAALFDAPSLDAIVNIGAAQLVLDLSPVERLVAPAGAELDGLRGALRVGPGSLWGTTDHLGGGMITMVRN